MYRAKMEECDSEIELHLRRFEDRSAAVYRPTGPAGSSRGNAPRFDVRTHLQDDRDRDRRSGQLHRAEGGDEVGVVSRWPTAKHFGRHGWA